MNAPRPAGRRRLRPRRRAVDAEARARRLSDPGAPVNGRPLVYLDSAASSQRPRAVLRAVEHYETTICTPTCIAACTP